MNKKRILMVDDDLYLTALVKEFMEQHGFEVIEAHDAQAGLAALSKEAPHLVLLDVMLPGKDGFTLCAQIREFCTVPIMMLTARGTVTDRVKGLKIGADDYLSKPFEPAELVARIEAILRRSHPAGNTQKLYFDSFTVDFAERVAESDGQRLDLTTAEFELLSLFVMRPNETLSRDQISQRLRGTEWEALSRSVDVVMSRLRQKLNDDPKNPRFFKTIWGSGYMFIGRPVRESR